MSTENARDALADEIARIEAAINRAGGTQFQRNDEFIDELAGERDEMLARIREIGNAVGCGHTDDSDGRLQLVNCVQEQVSQVREAGCDHSFVFLRAEEKNIGYDRNPLWLIQDVFHCQRCCEYKRVDVRKERDREDTFGRRIVENLV